MRRIWTASVGAVFAAELLAGCGDSKQIKDLKAQVEEAQDAATDANQKVEDLETKVDELSDRVDTLEQNSANQ